VEGYDQMKIYGDVLSGNCDKVRYTANLLGLPYEWIEIDSVHGQTRTPEYLAKFPQGQVPAVILDDGQCLAQSNAIMRYLARGSKLLPDDPYVQAKIDEWLFWEQNSHESFIANNIGHMTYKGQSKETRETWRVERGEKALDHMEQHLEQMSKHENTTPSIQPYLVGWTLTIADIALFAYTRNAHKGGFDMSGRPNIRNWIARTETALNIA
jgi:glutathione S-transferase